MRGSRRKEQSMNRWQGTGQSQDVGGMSCGELWVRVAPREMTRPPCSHQAGEGEPSSEAAEAAAGGGRGGGVPGSGSPPEAATRAGGCHRGLRVHEPGVEHAEEPASVRPPPRTCAPSLHKPQYLAVPSSLCAPLPILFCLSISPYLSLFSLPPGLSSPQTRPPHLHHPLSAPGFPTGGGRGVRRGGGGGGGGAGVWATARGARRVPCGPNAVTLPCLQPPGPPSLAPLVPVPRTTLWLLALWKWCHPLA